jgi:hypothetical protein
MIIKMMMQAAQQGMSPQQFFQQNAGNPAVAQIARISQGKNYEQLMQTAANMAKERGTSLEAVAQQMGLPYNVRG